MEHRWGQRFGASLPATLRSPDGAVASGHITDLSLSGAHVQTGLRLHPLAQVHVQIRDASHLRNRRIHAVVVRVTARGLGIEWLELGAAEVLARLPRPEPTPAQEPRSGTLRVSAA